MHIFTTIWDNLIKEPQWLVAIGTLALAITTYLSVRQSKKSEQKRINIDTLEKVVKPLYKNIREINCSLKDLILPSSFKKDLELYTYEDYPYFWEKIKQKSYYLLGNINKQTRNKIERFFVSLKMFIYSYNQNYGQLRDIIHDIIENKTGKSVDVSGNIFYQMTIGGKRIKVSIQNLIFLCQTLEKYIEISSNDPNILNKKTENEVFYLSRVDTKKLGRKDFEDIVNAIKEEISGKPELVEFIKICRNTHDEARNLMEGLNKLKNKLGN